MKYAFVWQRGFHPDITSKIEQQIQADLNSGHSVFRFCHHTSSEISFGDSVPYSDVLHATVVCGCGEIVGTIEGRIDASSLTYAAIS